MLESKPWQKIQYLVYPERIKAALPNANVTAIKIQELGQVGQDGLICPM